MTGLVGLAFAAVGGALFGVAAYNLLLAVAAFFRRSPPAQGRPLSRVVVLVPAHEEGALVARCVASLRAQDYPPDLLDVVVVADNCTDHTADAARAAGAEVLVRDEPDARGKGRALHWGFDRVLARRPPPDAVVVVDADSVAEPEFVAALVRPLERGAAAVQGESLLAPDGTRRTALRAAAFLLVNRTRQAGRAALGLPANLAGNGMLFSRALLEAVPWDAFSSTEDVEYYVTLRMAGVRPQFADGAILLSPAAPTREAAAEQELRWEGGKLRVARIHVARLLAAAVGRRRLSLLDTALELAVPPLGLLAAGLGLGTALGAVGAWAELVPWWSVAPWAAGLVCIPVYVVVGLRAAHAPQSAYHALAAAPLLVARKLLRMPATLRFRSETWVPTERRAVSPDPAVLDGEVADPDA